MKRSQINRIGQVIAAGFFVTSVASAGCLALDASTKFFTPAPNKDGAKQVVELIVQHDKDAARDLGKMLATPQAVWLENGSPRAVRKQARKVVTVAKALRRMPVLVAYNIPFRDCAQYSAGGATTPEEYMDWIDGVAEGIGNKNAIVILEPDGLGIIPHNTNLAGDPEWCEPAEADPATAVAERYEMLNYAVDTLGANPGTRVYLDGTHPGWLNVGDISDRLVKAGVDRAAGFFLNASNYHYTANNTHFGNWISQCIASGDFGNCPNQYWNGGPPEWQGVALSSFGEWSDTATDFSLDTSLINGRYAGMPEGTTHFVIDTSRNGQGPWDASGLGLSDAQDWCNPPDRGLGLRPSADTGSDLLDAYLWIKIPGESDGECNRGEAFDPVRGYTNPGAGEWFSEQALELLDNANPPL